MSTSINEKLLAILNAYQSLDAKEMDNISLIKDMIAQYSNITSRECQAAHITGSALVMHEPTGDVLLHYHKSLDKWLQFGGHMEVGEIDPLQTALREAQEESGLVELRAALTKPIDIDVHTIPGSKKGPEHLHLDFRYVLLTNERTFAAIAPDESQRLQWIAPAEAVHVVSAADTALLRLIAKAGQWWQEHLSM